MIRILSKLSASQQICQKLNEKKHFLKTLSSFFKAYKAQIHIIIRISYIFAYLFLDLGTWPPIFQISEPSYTSISRPGKISTHVSNIMQHHNFKAKTKSIKWGSVWQHGIIMRWKNNQMFKLWWKLLDLLLIFLRLLKLVQIYIKIVLLVIKLY